ncbi:hypothetical protein BAUCODRAFT_76236 [Baudoinia panamericana UAMH 10762]|uniref:Uncharacterized protein n=1 Tax=Baudoinia panamericana (strain UAMH 10762) TaxID=717646 RepID=M2N3X9_BAUPA|nr:uncharacterized protein BAUCODRAFT_76236 [Baudoinia panamericana UAMH 10762]EMC93415.1 hypothetical protein BAUCODRAFT_76236 [Baudoinia panamericana UAMH 10762]
MARIRQRQEERRRRDPASISLRTPDMATYSNTADNIERDLASDGHHLWGLVVYRCVYDDDARWAECIARLRRQIDNTMQFYNGMDLMDKFRLTVMEDRAHYDSQQPWDIREHFSDWAATAPEREQGVEDKTGFGLSVRYRYCIFIDKETQDSIVDNVPILDRGTLTDTAFVKIVSKNWMPGFGATRPEYEEELGEDADFGWMMVQASGVASFLFYYLRDANAWHSAYRPPPIIAQA